LPNYDYGNLVLVLLNVVLFSLFLLTIPFRKRTGRRLGGAYLAFVVALYTEMYGFPLTIYILTWLLGYQNPLTHVSGHLLGEVVGEGFFFSFLHPLSELLMFLGGIIVIVSWRRVYGSRGSLVTDGIYAVVRHPQYLGFLLLTSGMLIQWTTIPTALMWPILVILYHRLAKEEEREMEATFGEKYLQYKSKVPMFIPFFGREKRPSFYRG